MQHKSTETHHFLLKFTFPQASSSSNMAIPSTKCSSQTFKHLPCFLFLSLLIQLTAIPLTLVLNIFWIHPLLSISFLVTSTKSFVSFFLCSSLLYNAEYLTELISHMHFNSLYEIYHYLIMSFSCFLSHFYLSPFGIQILWY